MTVFETSLQFGRIVAGVLTPPHEPSTAELRTNPNIHLSRFRGIYPPSQGTEAIVWESETRLDRWSQQAADFLVDDRIREKIVNHLVHDYTPQESAHMFITVLRHGTLHGSDWYVDALADYTEAMWEQKEEWRIFAEEFKSSVPSTEYHASDDVTGVLYDHAASYINLVLLFYDHLQPTEPSSSLANS